MSKVPTVLCRCLNPKKVFNPYTKENMIVPCGHCQACNLQRNHHWSLLCDLEAQSHKYCMFITLTYANRFIPRAQLVDNITQPFSYDLVDADGNVLDTISMSEEERTKLLDKFHLFGCVPYLRKSDLQKFFKRFRFYAKKISSARVRYFACGEYGPAHFRPHFHILLFFDDQTLMEACEQIVCQSWPFGRIDVQLSRGNCTSYVASYVNSSVYVPKVLKVRAARPFCVHSQKLGQGILQGQRSQIYSLSAKEIIRRSVVCGEKYREFNLWRSYYSYYFPKCRGFVDKSSCERAYSYTVYEYARKSFPECTSVIDLARKIAATIFYFGTERGTFADIETERLCYYFRDDTINDITSESADRWIQRIYTELLLSKHFLYFVCDHVTSYEIDRKIKLIVNFYSEMEYLRLVDFFENQRMFFDSDLYGSDDLLDVNSDNAIYPYFYDNFEFNMNEYKITPVFTVMSSKVLDEFGARQKHKTLNDINKLLFND